MTKEHLRFLRDTAPFKPFTIHMADGRSFPVPHRDFLTISPAGRTIIVFDQNDTMHLLDLLLMTELSVDSEAIPPHGASNGVSGNGTES